MSNAAFFEIFFYHIELYFPKNGTCLICIIYLIQISHMFALITSSSGVLVQYQTSHRWNSFKGVKDPFLSNLIVAATTCDNNVCITTSAQRMLLSVWKSEVISVMCAPPTWAHWSTCKQIPSGAFCHTQPAHMPHSLLTFYRRHYNTQKSYEVSS